MALVAGISERRKDRKGENELFDLTLTNGMTIIAMRHCQSHGKHWVDFPATGYVKDGEPRHFAFLRATPMLRKELNRECLEHLGVTDKEPHLV